MRLRRFVAEMRSSYLFDLFKMYSATLGTRIINMLGSLVTARILGPTNQGFSKSVELIQSYYPASSAGTTNGMSRNLAMAYGQKDEQKAKQIINTTFVSLFSLPLLVTTVCLAFPLIGSLDTLTSLAFETAAVASFLSLATNINTRILNAQLKFGTYAKIGILTSIAGTIISVVFVYLFSIEGRLWANVISIVVGFAISMVYVRHKYRFELNLGELRALLKIGFPIMVVGLTYALLLGIDRWIILLFLSLADLGYYSIAITFSQFISGITEALSEITYQRLNRRYGETLDPRDLFAVAAPPSQLLSLVLPYLIGMLVIWLPLLVHIALPKFQPGVTAAQIYIFGTFIYGLSINVLNTISRQKIYFALQVVMIVVNSLLGYVLVKHFGLIGVAIATSISFFVYSILLTLVSLRIMGKTLIEAVGFAAKLISPGMYSIAMIVLITILTSEFWLGIGTLQVTLLQSFLFSVAYLPLGKPLVRSVKVFVAQKHE